MPIPCSAHTNVLLEIASQDFQNLGSDHGLDPHKQSELEDSVAFRKLVLMLFHR